MSQLRDEVLAITKELHNVVFVGAIAVLFHLGWRHRRTRDINIALATNLREDALKEELERQGYRTFQEGRKEVVRSPRGYKVDIYTEDVSGIPLDTVFDTAQVFSTLGGNVKAASLEVLLLAKLRAGRPQDMEDLRDLCKRKGDSVDWQVLQQIATKVELSTIKQSVTALR